MRFIWSIIWFFRSLFWGVDKRSYERVTSLPTKVQKSVARLTIREFSKSLNFTAENVDDLPDEEKVKNKTIYIVGENGYLWLAAFKCPCGCEELIQLNLLPDTRPFWRISYKKGNIVSLSPSIDRINGCKTHFIVEKGCIQWWSSNVQY